MTRPPRHLFAPLVGLLVVLAPAAARADLVKFQNGRVLSVASCHIVGDTAIIVTREGGEIRTPKAFVLEIVPDEVPYVPPAAPSPAVAIELVQQTAEVVVDATDLRAMVSRLASEHGVDPQLAHAVVLVESNYQPRAISVKGAMGLMQLMPDTARQYAVDDPFDPVKNVNAGLRHLRGLLDKFGSSKVSLALAAYNAGAGAVARYKGIPPYRETQDYVRRILSIARR